MSAADYNNRMLANQLIDAEHITELTKYWQAGHELKVDGLCGPQTLASIEALFPESAPISGWPFWEGPAEVQPQNRREVYGTMGNPASTSSPGKASSRWERENLIECHPRHGNQLPGVPSNRYIKVHRIVEPYLREGLRRAAISCPSYPIERIGVYNFRHIRHDVSRPLSMHAFGVAVDINPQWNRGIQYRRGEVIPQAWTPEWFKVWPQGVPQAFVEAMQSCGFAWGSDWDEDGSNTDHTWQDPMHFEWLARDGSANLV
jgi:hypothetical protein